MYIQDILSQINALPEIGGSILCTLSGVLIAEDMPDYQSKYRKGVLPGKVQELVGQFNNDEGFIELPGTGREDKWIAIKYKNLVLVASLYPGADPHLVKMHLDVSMHELRKDKKIQKILSKENSILISTCKQIRILDFFKFQDNLKKEGFNRGIIIAKMPYDNKVKNELTKQDNRIEIVISDSMKKELKRLTKSLSEQGYSVKYKALITGRGM